MASKIISLLLLLYLSSAYSSGRTAGWISGQDEKTLEISNPRANAASTYTFSLTLTNQIPAGGVLEIYFSPNNFIVDLGLSNPVTCTVNDITGACSVSGTAITIVVGA